MLIDLGLLLTGAIVISGVITGFACIIVAFLYSLFVLYKSNHLPDSHSNSLFRWLNQWFIPEKRKLLTLGITQLLTTIFSYLLFALDGWYQGGLLFQLALIFLGLSFIICESAFLFFLLNMKTQRWKSIIPFLLVSVIFYASWEAHSFKLGNKLIQKRLESNLPQYQSLINDIQSGQMQPDQMNIIHVPASFPAHYVIKRNGKDEPLKLYFYTGGYLFTQRGYLYTSDDSNPENEIKLLPHWYWYMN